MATVAVATEVEGWAVVEMVAAMVAVGMAVGWAEAATAEETVRAAVAAAAVASELPAPASSSEPHLCSCCSQPTASEAVPVGHWRG